MSSDKTECGLSEKEAQKNRSVRPIFRTDTGENNLNSEGLVLRYTLLHTKPKLHHLP